VYYTPTTKELIENWLKGSCCWSLWDLAQALKCTEQHLQKLFKGKARLSISMTIKLSKILGTPESVYFARESAYQYARQGVSCPRVFIGNGRNTLERILRIGSWEKIK
jgi:plasmid maintenance system antidote protein VapI